MQTSEDPRKLSIKVVFSTLRSTSLRTIQLVLQQLSCSLLSLIQISLELPCAWTCSKQVKLSTDLGLQRTLLRVFLSSFNHSCLKVTMVSSTIIHKPRLLRLRLTTQMLSNVLFVNTRVLLSHILSSMRKNKISKTSTSSEIQRKSCKRNLFVSTAEFASLMLLSVSV